MYLYKFIEYQEIKYIHTKKYALNAVSFFMLEVSFFFHLSMYFLSAFYTVPTVWHFVVFEYTLENTEGAFKKG